MEIRYFQKGFNFSQDGPGNRLVYHLQGCNFCCPWCANPEGIAPRGTLMVCGELSDGCCSRGAIKNGELDRSICRSCEQNCVRNPASNIKLSCVTESVDDIVKEVCGCEMMFFDGGGVTLTGGEPTVQFDAVKELLTELKQHNINTALECNASHVRLPELFGVTDYLITDCKHYNSEKHRAVCSVGNEAVINNIAVAARERSQLLVRIPLINGFNSSPSDAEEFAKLFCSIGSSAVSYELLRYHEFGKDKFAKCAMEYTVTDGFVSDSDSENFKEIFRNNGLRLIHT